MFYAAVLLAAVITSTMSAQTQLPGQSTPEFQISRIAMAVENVEGMVKFYENVFNTHFDSLDAGGVKLYYGNLLGFSTLLAPNSLAGVEAKQSRHQFELFVKNLEEVKKRVMESGGSVREEEVQNGSTVATIVDPDGNTIILIERKEQH
jgi:predicted enzyme related to lactoylglutathione lyase